MLRGVSRTLGYRDSESLIHLHLYYLVAEWLNQTQADSLYTLQSFPYTLMGYRDLEEFYRYWCEVGDCFTTHQVKESIHMKHSRILNCL